MEAKKPKFKFFSIFEKFGVNEKKNPNENALVYKSDQCEQYLAIPPESYFVTSKLALIPFPRPEICEAISSYFTGQFGTKYMI